MSSAEGGSQSSSKMSQQPKYSKFTQQELPACKPILTPGLVVMTFIVIGVLFIPIGLSSLAALKKVVEIVDLCDEDCIPPGQEECIHSKPWDQQNLHQKFASPEENEATYFHLLST